MKKEIFRFPNPVNEAAARTVALGVFTMAVLALVTNDRWILIPLTYGFAARVSSGPKISPLGRLAVSIVAPWMERSKYFHTWVRFVPGPPKRFAQGIGLFVTSFTTVLWFSIGWEDARWVLLLLIVAAALEGFVGYCLGCTIFGWLIRTGVVPESVCAQCSDLQTPRKPTTKVTKSRG